MGLTERERQQFEELGYVIKPGVYTESALQPLRDGLSDAITTAENVWSRREGFPPHTKTRALSASSLRCSKRTSKEDRRLTGRSRDAEAEALKSSRCSISCAIRR